MLLYILKSVACMAIFFVFYKVFLEKESVHVFKRFYLLLAVGAALLIPAIVFTDYVVVEPVPYIETPQTVVTDYDYIGIPSAFEKDVLDIEPVLWTIYFLGFTFFGLRFIQNLRQVIARIRKNPKQKSSNFIQVLLQESFPPHTFFQYIFLNKKELESNAIPKEVLLHEETHARQRHSLDVVSIELLQVIFWFNPFVYVFKKAIKLNHEFLADSAVLQKEINPTTYQNTLLSYLSPDSEKKYQPSLANAINYSSYSSIKKRFTIMKTRTSRKSIGLRSILLLPLLALLVYGFSNRESVYQEATSEIYVETRSECEDLEHLTIRLYDNKLDIEGKTFETGMDWLTYLDTTYGPSSENDEGANIHFALINEDNSENNIKGLLSAFSGGVWQVHESPSEKQLLEYDRLSKKYNAIPIEKRIIPSKDLKILKTIYNNMTDIQKQDAQPFPNCLPKNSQQGATKKQIKEYNALAKKYNRQLSEEKNIRIYKPEVERLEYLYALMTQEQKENAETFPDFPEPPPSPKAPKAPKVSKGEQSAIPPPPKTPKPTGTPDKNEKEFAEEAVDEIIANQDPYDFVTVPVATSYSSNSTLNYRGSEAIQHNSAMQKIDERQELNEHHFIPKPSDPPAPKSPLDHVVEMAKKGAVFYYEGNKISSDEAISILKKNKSINIETRGSNGNKPVVKLSTAPITID
ncbi:M56 family metallopeptidase [Aggregatimonas sangjinii]|uniref:M56 family metallopeptidase n=1 Tax=Aggregatimonas sangjinii TaxID=2583587 RepID=A0A5B7SSX3_9FLAO|nr:M56 family metallopeptidase [Aggregatimonas sangjinii]QCX01292.1 M56 family metallopeptidase [Aggregatimonas sangjinii]